MNNVFICFVVMFQFMLMVAEMFSTHVVFEPELFDSRSHLLVDHDFLQVLQWWMLTNLLLEWQHVFIHRPWTHHNQDSEQMLKWKPALLPSAVEPLRIQSRICVCVCVLPSAALQRDTSSHSTRPMAYMSIRRKASRWKLMAPSKTSGAMYRLVPTCTQAHNSNGEN